jgi:hypothetical protein
VIKGGSLAHTLYPRSYLRPRTDTDVLVDRGAVDFVARTLDGLGYEADVETDGTLSTAQRHFSRRDAHGVLHAWDVHWRISNAQAAARALSLEEITARGSRPAALGGLVAPGFADALLLACVHRIAHHHDAGHLLWLYDIHGLAGQLGAPEWDGFAERASRRGMSGACARSLAGAERLFGTAVPDRAREWHRDAEPLAAFGPGWRQVDVLTDDLRALPTWSARCRLVREHLFPPPAFIEARYGATSRASLAGGYLRRILSGAPKWFRRHPAA